MTETSDPGLDEIRARRQRHAEILAEGGYPDRFERTDLAEALHDRYTGLEPGSSTDDVVSVAGRLMLYRSFGKLQFGTLRDDSGTIQLLVDVGTIGEGEAEAFTRVDLGDWIGATGRVMTTRKGELSVAVEEFVVLQKSLRPLPDKWHGLQDVELRSRRRYLDLMVNAEAREVARTRISVVAELRRQFQSRGFLEVETPILLSQATGANARPFVTHHHALDMEMNLRIATELYLKRLVVGGMEKVYEVGRIFRNEGIDSTHNPEFTMLEAYQALADYSDIMGLVEEVVSSVAGVVAGSTTITYQGRDLDLSTPFRRATMLELVSNRLETEVDLSTPANDLAALSAERAGIEVDPGWSTARIAAEVYEEAVEPDIWEPTFVTHQPVEISPLSRRNREDPRLADRFELVIAGAEYANAFSELNDPDDQRERFEAQAEAREAGDVEAHPVDEDYLLALEYGMPPTGGLGIGVDRLVMLLTDQPHIREVILFPTLRPE